MPDVKSADGKEESTSLRSVRRVSTEAELYKFLATVRDNPQVTMYATKHYNDPDTLILYRENACLITSIIEHDFFGRIALIVWGQNKDKRVTTVRQALEIIKWWAKDDMRALSLVAFVGEEGPWKRIKGFCRLTGMRPFRMVFSKEL
jgi:hypothetical protein